jgi:PadR family transcriptional regulator, regulatory protein PadR
MDDLTKFRRDLLYVVSGLDDPHGLAIHKELENYYEKDVHYGRLYPNLDTLAEEGLIQKRQADRRTNIYSVTSRGEHKLKARREWESQYVNL